MSRILNPIVLTLEKLDDLQENAGLRDYVNGTFGGIEHCRKDILRKLKLRGIIVTTVPVKNALLCGFNFIYLFFYYS